MSTRKEPISREEAKKQIQKMHDEEIVNSQMQSVLGRPKSPDCGGRVRRKPTLDELDGSRV